MAGRKTALRVATLAAAVTIPLSACSAGLQDLPLGAGSGDSFDVTAELITADGVVSGADVRHGQQIVGRVTDIGLYGNHAEITMTLEDGTTLPANTNATVELPSALGTPFIRLSAPKDPEGELSDGSHLPLAQTSVGPQIESTLAALGNILGGSGVSQLQSVMNSLNTAFENRSDKVGDLIDTLNRLLSRSSVYTNDFNAAIAAATEVSNLLVSQRTVVDDFLQQAPTAVGVLAAQRDQVASLMRNTTTLAVNLDAVVKGRQASLNTMVANANILVQSLAAFNGTVGTTLNNMNSFMRNFNRAIRGDYLVFDGALDIPGGIDKILTGGLLLSGQPLPTPKQLEDALTGGLGRPQKQARANRPATPQPSPARPTTTRPGAPR
ncbi:MCE family protein [Gordonia sp. ABSL49_1]|uniref:MCE family protein n=1 Tax=Gordonia sp. ABSL49_1 TaxID=2920941 RepID=UPI001F0EE8A5|nr:MCE family protein [Gordonia sp. ABSL49_1]MCH5641967.1 MCE family protein [Gordonia sp. ABSL49_1]